MRKGGLRRQKSIDKFCFVQPIYIGCNNSPPARGKSRRAVIFSAFEIFWIDSGSFFPFYAKKAEKGQTTRRSPLKNSEKCVEFGEFWIISAVSRLLFK